MMDYIALPKIELHAHLSGSISRQCLHEVWLMKKEAGETDLADPLVEMPDGKHDYNLKTFFPLFSSYIYHLVNDLAALRHTTLSVLRDFAADGVVYLELRTTPRALPRSGLSKEGYVEAILAVIREYEASPSSSGNGTATQLHTRLILSVDRRNTPSEAAEVVTLAQRLQPLGVVGVDLCGDPLRGGVEALQPAFEAARDCPGLGVTLHFGEAEASGSDAELLMMLREWRPHRIGHVIHLSDVVKREVAAYPGGLGLELCLSCNVRAGMVSGGFEGHHFGEWWKVDQCTVVLCTDDVGVFGSPLSNEYRLVAEHFGLSEPQIRALARKGIEVIFGGPEEKQRLRDIMDSAS
ncbi:hypothetical protein FJTKL_06021 [Diaporthe vaccinii]|uniref:Adenosine deaminase domain-containing protein n=1 Tax=Diaporthe vaccinii TaxID=105482 RepID=A0ABR4DQS3_9PEZI